MAVFSFSGTAAINSAINFFDFSFPNTLTVIGRTEGISVNEIILLPFAALLSFIYCASIFNAKEELEREVLNTFARGSWSSSITDVNLKRS